MSPIQHPSNNQVFGAPENWDQNVIPCNALAVTICSGDFPCVQSFWKPNARELTLLNNGATICLWVFGASMPPVYLSVDGTE